VVEGAAAAGGARVSPPITLKEATQGKHQHFCNQYIRIHGRGYDLKLIYVCISKHIACTKCKDSFVKSKWEKKTHTSAFCLLAAFSALYQLLPLFVFYLIHLAKMYSRKEYT
jgi:hypothetical protein